MKKLIGLSATFLGMLVLTACGGNKLDGMWVSYSDTTEKDKEILDINVNKGKVTVTSYDSGEKENVDVADVNVDDDKETITFLSSEGISETVPFVLEKDKLFLSQKEWYKEGSQEEQKARNKAEKKRKKIEAEEAKEQEEEKKKKETEKRYNDSVKELEQRLNKEFLKTYKGTWYGGEGLDSDSIYPNTTAYKLVVDEKMSFQETRITVPESDSRDVGKEEVENYTFSGIILPEKHEYTEVSSSDDVQMVEENYEIPGTKEEIQDIKNIADFADFEKEHNVRMLYFEYQSNGGDISDVSLALNVNDLSHLEKKEIWENTIFGRELPSGVEVTDFD